MDDDLNVSAALAAVYSIVRRINRLNQAGHLSRQDAVQLIDAFRQVDQVLDVFDFEPPEVPDGLEALIQAREAARAAGDWDTADRIREELRARGLAVMDPKL
jgi:cysteinyl-tRNA synthetase